MQDQLTSGLEKIRSIAKEIQTSNPSYMNCIESAKSLSHEIDMSFGFKIAEIEADLLQKYRKISNKEDKDKEFSSSETWVGLHPDTLQTTYPELIKVFHYLKSRDINKIVDLGAAYGRLGLVGAALRPSASFLGFEVIAERSLEGQRIFTKLGLTAHELRNQNILDDSFILPSADLYLIYDFSSPEDIRKILNKLSEKLFKEPFFIVARGEGVRSLIQNKYPEFFSCNGVLHEPTWSLYSSTCSIEDLTGEKYE